MNIEDDEDDLLFCVSVQDVESIGTQTTPYYEDFHACTRCNQYFYEPDIFAIHKCQQLSEVTCSPNSVISSDGDDYSTRTVAVQVGLVTELANDSHTCGSCNMHFSDITLFSNHGCGLPDSSPVPSFVAEESTDGENTQSVRIEHQETSEDKLLNSQEAGADTGIAIHNLDIEHSVESSNEDNETENSTVRKLPSVFECDVCNSTFVGEGSWRKHKLKHEGKLETLSSDSPLLKSEDISAPRQDSKSFKCHVCSSEFSHMALWRNHMRKHSNEVSYITPDIPRKRRKENEDSPLSNSASFKCSFCEAVFVLEGAWKAHMHQCHGSDVGASEPLLLVTTEMPNDNVPESTQSTGDQFATSNSFIVTFDDIQTAEVKIEDSSANKPENFEQTEVETNSLLVMEENKETINWTQELQLGGDDQQPIILYVEEGTGEAVNAVGEELQSAEILASLNQPIVNQSIVTSFPTPCHLAVGETLLIRRADNWS